MYQATLTHYEGKPIAYFYDHGVIYITWYNFTKLTCNLVESRHIVDHDSYWKKWPYTTNHNFTGKKLERFVTEFGIQRFLLQSIINEDAPWDEEPSEGLLYLEGLLKHIIDTIGSFRKGCVPKCNESQEYFENAAFGKE